MKTLSEKTCDQRDVRQRICAGIKKGIGRSGGFRKVFGSAPDMRQRQIERPRKKGFGPTGRQKATSIPNEHVRQVMRRIYIYIYRCS